MNQPEHTPADRHDRTLLALREQLPPPRPITLSDDHRRALQRRTLAAARRTDRRREVVRTVAPAGLVVACLATAVALLATTLLGGAEPGPTDGPRPVAAAPAAASRLQAIAAVAGRAPTPAVGDDQFVYVRSAVVSNEAALGEAPDLGAVHEREIWLAQDPDAHGSRGSLIREDGQDWPIVTVGSDPAGARRPTYSWLASLPTDPDRLLDELEALAVPVDGQEPEQAVFDLMTGLVRETVLPPDLAAALYRAARLVPGVVLERGAEDAVGRRGVGISRTDERFRSRTLWVVDPGTGELLGTRDHLLGPDGEPMLFHATAVLERAVVDEPGREPAGGGRA
ncbi:CU044_5270 family protein [Nocardioides abyssi]|uniref:CU044_5270 family protein n=1 Tax=Nocardioides abyssi TaxID=3058370 RepID=A0ABT8EXS7_9ACTN|nr:CU044_5270 family protein [Nocardioides abyssi]MDN4162987.1 CU044_5270 family protein [Nocardioides abyssi]